MKDIVLQLLIKDGALAHPTRARAILH
jgi:hypothetical protein